MKLVFATNNQHKLDEVRKITTGYTEIVSLSDIDCHDDIPETAETLEGNALQKARYIKENFGYDCFADDTGLEVEALDNAPGVYSARYAGPGHDSEANMNKLLHEMESKENRKARFRTVIALILDGKEYLFEGIVNGTIIEEKRGGSGFGYRSCGDIRCTAAAGRSNRDTAGRCSTERDRGNTEPGRWRAGSRCRADRR